MRKFKLTFVVPASLQMELRECVARDGYGFRGKSKWVSEAIDSLLILNNYIELVHYSEDMQDFTCSETVLVDAALKSRLDAAILAIRQAYPTLEGVQSAILRTAIMQRFLRS